MGAAGAEEVGELALGEQGVGGEGAAAEVEPQVLEHGDNGADFDPTAGGRRALGLVVGADREAVDFFWVWVTPLRWPTAPRMWTWYWFSADLARRGLGVVGAGAAAVGLEALQGAVELVGADAHQDVADDELAGHLVAAAAVPAPEPLAYRVGDRSSAHSAMAR